MSWIDVIDEQAAEGRLAEVYDRIGGKRGKVANIMRVHSLKPEAMDAHLDLYLAVMFETSGLTRENREVIAVAVSAANDCPYCITHHAEALNAYWRDDERLEAFVDDPFGYQGLDDRQRVLVDYALQLTDQPAGISQTAIEELRAAGLDDEEILCANLVAGYFNFVNRVALGLGVDFSDREAGGYEY